MIETNWLELPLISLSSTDSIRNCTNNIFRMRASNFTIHTIFSSSDISKNLCIWMNKKIYRELLYRALLKRIIRTFRSKKIKIYKVYSEFMFHYYFFFFFFLIFVFVLENKTLCNVIGFPNIANNTVFRTIDENSNRREWIFA